MKEFLGSQPIRVAERGEGWPRISVITPSYNQGAFIEWTVQSVLNQGYPNLEYIVIDGLSTDRTREVLSRYKEYFAHLVVGPDGGQADAIHKGFALATGHVICWLNSDDVFLPNTLLQVAATFIRNPSVEFVHGHSVLIDEANNIKKWLFTYPGCYWPRYKYLDNQFQGSLFWTCAAYERFGGIDSKLKVAMEYPLVAYLFTHEKGCFINQHLAAFREHSSQKTKRLAKEGMEEIQVVLGYKPLTFAQRIVLGANRALQLALTGNVLRKMQAMYWENRYARTRPVAA